jgi:hypothetical protein
MPSFPRVEQTVLRAVSIGRLRSSRAATRAVLACPQSRRTGDRGARQRDGVGVVDDASRLSRSVIHPDPEHGTGVERPAVRPGSDLRGEERRPRLGISDCSAQWPRPFRATRPLDPCPAIARCREELRGSLHERSRLHGRIRPFGKNLRSGHNAAAADRALRLWCSNGSPDRFALEMSAVAEASPKRSLRQMVDCMQLGLGTHASMR